MFQLDKLCPVMRQVRSEDAFRGGISLELLFTLVLQSLVAMERHSGESCGRDWNSSFVIRSTHSDNNHEDHSGKKRCTDDHETIGKVQ